MAKLPKYPAASRWKMFLARVFGRKHVGKDGNVTVTSYLYRGNLYVYKIDTGEQ